MGNKIRSTKAIAGVLKRMEKQPNNEFPVDGSLRCEAWQNHLNTSPGPEHLDSYQTGPEISREEKIQERAI